MLNISTHQSAINFLSLAYMTDILSIYLSSFLVFIGILGNLSVLAKFIRYNVKTVNILTKKMLIVLTISNSIYLILFWYVSVLPKLINNLKLNMPLNGSHSNATINSNNELVFPKSLLLKFYRINSNVFLCKLISYLISVCIFMNSSIISMFSLERALAINFPFKMRNTREKYRSLIKFIIFLVIMYSILFPTYNLIITNLVKYNSENFGQFKCDVPKRYESFYFKFTIAFVVQTLGLPFCLITLSNISILIAIERNRKNLLNSKFRQNAFSNVEIDTNKAPVYLERYYFPNQTKHSNQDSNSLELKPFRKKMDSCKSGQDPMRLMRIRKKFFVISASFVLLNFPYFLAWNKYAFYRMNMSRSNYGLKLEEAKILSELFNIVKLTEVLNLCNYAMIGFLYFTVKKCKFQNIFKFKLSSYFFRRHLNN